MKKLTKKLFIFEHLGGTKKFIKSFDTYEQVCEFINKQYKTNTNADDLRESLERYFGSAWLYLRFFEVEVTIEE